MSMLDKAKDLLGQHGDQAKEGVEKAGDAIDAKTDGKYASQVDKGQEQAGAFIDKNKEGA
jgi:hypothetical protein